jgi:hypothetical protein
MRRPFISLFLFCLSLCAAQNRAIDSLKALLKDPGKDTLTAYNYNHLAILLSSKGDYTEAATNYLNAIKLYETLKKPLRVAEVYNNLGILFFKQRNFKEAVNCYKRSLDTKEKMNFKNGLAATYSNLGLVYAESGDSLEAEKMFLRSLELEIESKNFKGVAQSYQTIAQLAGEKTPKYAMLLFNRALEIFDSLKCDDEKTTCYGSIAVNLANIGQYAEAIEYTKKGLLSKSIPIYERRIFYEILAESYFHVRKYEKSHTYFNMLNNIKDSMYSADISLQAEELNKKYESEQKEAKIIGLSQENKIQALTITNNRYFLLGLTALVLLILALGILVFRQNKLRSEQRTIQLEQKLLRSQMNPHFIFNSLIAIESFIYKNDAKTAGKYLSGFARLMRLILENSREEYVTLEKEIQTLEHYLNLQCLRYDGNFEYSILLDETIDPAMISIPPMLAQPFIENSIEHGLKGLAYKGKIGVKFSLKENELQFEVEDNGMGFDAAAKLKNEKQHRSMATTITLERLTILNKRKHRKIKWTAGDIKDAMNMISGARVVFSIPLRDT